MHANVNAAALDIQQAACFERLKNNLLSKELCDRLSRPLGYWALPSDRRLPRALLDIPLAEVLRTPLSELAATRGIGRKKIESLFVLLARAAADRVPGADLAGLNDVPAENPPDASPNQPQAATPGTANVATKVANSVDANAANGAMAGFDPGIVSEALWQQWQSSVRAAGVADLPIGRIVPSLERVPSVIWQAPLSQYVDRPLAEIRGMRTHGVKRIGVILHAYYLVNRACQSGHSSTAVRQALAPRFVLPIENWSAACTECGDAPTEEELKSRLVEPLLAQFEIDCGELVARLARQRLGLDGKPLSVRGLARRLNVTRARIYQIFEQCGKAMEVRWPGGRRLLRRFEVAVHRRPAENATLRLLTATVDLCFPRRMDDGADDGGAGDGGVANDGVVD